MIKSEKSDYQGCVVSKSIRKHSSANHSRSNDTELVGLLLGLIV